MIFGQNTAQRSSDLCVSCGMCCDGTLFTYADLLDGEKVRVDMLGIPTGTHKKSGKDYLHLPCPKFDGGCCSVYANRPQICQRYLCDLTRGVLNGSVSYRRAKARVTALRKRRDDLLSSIPPRVQAEIGDKPHTHLYGLLNAARKVLRILHAGSGFTPDEVRFIERAFEALKRIDRNFDRTHLLRHYGDLMRLAHG